MILPWLIAIPILGGLLALVADRVHPSGPRWVALLALGANLALSVFLWAGFGVLSLAEARSPWLAEYRAAWIPNFGISFHLAVDGLSLLLVVLTAFLGAMAVLASWREVRERAGLFHFNVLWVLAGISGVFLAVDLFLFAFFWELMLVPTYFLFFWGRGRRLAAAIKIFIFTQAGGLLMLLSIIGLALLQAAGTGAITFDYADLLRSPAGGATAFWLMLGFFVAFAVKLPVVPLHTWLPDAYATAPTGATVILAGLMAKTGGYGLLRFVVPLFPEAALAFAPVAMALAVASILYGAGLAFAQTDLKRLVAYSSLSHMGFVMLGAFAWNEWALQGAVMVMIAHGISVGALFILAGALQERLQTSALDRMGGLWATAPRLGGAMLFFALGTLGLPGLGNFVGEFLTLLGSFAANATLAVVAVLGIVLATVYALWMLQSRPIRPPDGRDGPVGQRTFQGPNEHRWRIPDLSAREAFVAAALVAALLWLGLFPQPVLDTAGQAIANLQRSAGAQVVAEPAAPAVDGASLLRGVGR